MFCESVYIAMILFPTVDTNSALKCSAANYDQAFITTKLPRTVYSMLAGTCLTIGTLVVNQVIR